MFQRALQRKNKIKTNQLHKNGSHCIYLYLDKQTKHQFHNCYEVEVASTYCMNIFFSSLETILEAALTHFKMSKFTFCSTNDQPFWESW